MIAGGATPGCQLMPSALWKLSAACGQAMPRAEALKNSAAAAGAMPK